MKRVPFSLVVLFWFHSWFRFRGRSSAVGVIGTIHVVLFSKFSLSSAGTSESLLGVITSGFGYRDSDVDIVL